MLHNARHCELPRSFLLSERRRLMVITTAVTHHSVIDGTTAGGKTFSSTIYQGLFLLARRSSRRTRLVSITVNKGRSIGLRRGEVVVCTLECSLREELTGRRTCDSSIGRCPEARKEVTKALLFRKSHVVRIRG